jgi:hypothetical protein
MLGIPLDSLNPSSTAYASMQRLALRYDKTMAHQLKDEYEKEGLPICGFKKGEIKVTPKEKLFSAISGIVFLAVLLIIAIYFPNPTDFQIFIFRVVLAISAGAFASVVSGFLTVRTNLPKVFVQAGGGLAVFIVIYALNPPKLITSKSDDRSAKPTSVLTQPANSKEAGTNTAAHGNGGPQESSATHKTSR